MDRDTLQDDLDQILGPSRDAELPGEWDWEPPLGTVAPASGPAVEPEETDDDPAGDPADDEEDD